MTSSDSTFVVHKDLYFADGSIVLNVIEENYITRFRAHKSVLARNSFFFAAMFDIPQPSPDPSELVEGCPVIDLTGDSVNDWIIILSALYNVFFNQNQLPTSTIIAMLRLGRKYQFPDLERDAQYRLRQWYPSTLSGLRSREQPSSCPFELNNSSELLQIVEEGIIPDEVLPVLYYDHLHLLNKFNDPGENDNTTPVDEKITLRLLVGHRRLLTAQYNNTFACLLSLQHPCRTANACKNAARAAHNFLRASDPSGNVTIRPFVTLNVFKAPKYNLCEECRLVVSAGLEIGATEVWDLLPWAFGLGSWEELLKDAQDKEREEEQ